MALPELLKLSVEKKLSEYCRKKVSPLVADKLRIGFRFRGNSITLFEERPLFSDPSKWVEIVIHFATILRRPEDPVLCGPQLALAYLHRSRPS